MPEIYPLDLRRSINSCDFHLSLGNYAGLRIHSAPGKWPRRWRKPSALLHASKIARSLTRAKRELEPCKVCDGGVGLIFRRYRK